MEVDEHHHQYNATASSSNLKRTADSSDSEHDQNAGNNNTGLPGRGKKPPGKPRAKRRAVRDADEMKNAVKTDKSCLRCKLRKGSSRRSKLDGLCVFFWSADVVFLGQIV